MARKNESPVIQEQPADEQASQPDASFTADKLISQQAVHFTAEKASHLDAVMEADGSITPLESLAEQDLRQLASQMRIDGAETLPTDELLAEVQAEPVGSDPVEALHIRAVPAAGIRRIGQRFTREGHAIALSALTAQEIEQLHADPSLVVKRVTFSDPVETD